MSSIYIRLTFLGIVLLCVTKLFGIEEVENTDQKDEKPYLWVTIPKSGTHLSAKLLNLLSTKPHIFVLSDDQLKYNKKWNYFPPKLNLDLDYFLKQYPRVKGECIGGHFNFSHLLLPFLEKHPEYAPMIHIRDLRDVCVAITFALWDMMSTHMHPQLNFDQRLTYVIQGFENTYYERSVWSVTLNAKEAKKWMQYPGVLVIRFENLVGRKGGGSDELQEQEILKVANALNIPISDEKIQRIKKQLFGNSPTFRKGKIGSWKQHFKPNHKTEFKKHLGQLLIDFGYEKDNNW